MSLAKSLDEYTHRENNDQHANIRYTVERRLQHPESRNTDRGGIIWCMSNILKKYSWKIKRVGNTIKFPPTPPLNNPSKSTKY